MSLHKNKTYFITGGSRGIGAGIVKYLAHQGARIAFTYTSGEEASRKLIESLPGEGHKAYPLNVNDEDSVTSTFKQLLNDFDQVDGLVNNAGIAKDQILLRMKSQDFDDVIQTNLRGGFLCTKAILKHMLKKRSGSIVNISSVIGTSGNPGQSNYAASKAGIEAFTKSVAQEVATRNIRLNSVAPGFIITEMTEALSDEQKNKVTQKIPMQRLGIVEDIAKAVGFLLSDDSSYMTGQTLHVNGGLYM